MTVDKRWNVFPYAAVTFPGLNWSAISPDVTIRSPTPAISVIVPPTITSYSSPLGTGMVIGVTILSCSIGGDLSMYITFGRVCSGCLGAGVEGGREGHCLGVGVG